MIEYPLSRGVTEQMASGELPFISFGTGGAGAVGVYGWWKPGWKVQGQQNVYTSLSKSFAQHGVTHVNWHFNIGLSPRLLSYPRGSFAFQSDWGPDEGERVGGGKRKEN